MAYEVGYFNLILRGQRSFNGITQNKDHIKNKMGNQISNIIIFQYSDTQKINKKFNWLVFNISPKTTVCLLCILRDNDNKIAQEGLGGMTLGNIRCSLNIWNNNHLANGKKWSAHKQIHEGFKIFKQKS